MTEYEVPDMTCGGCAASITRALESADPGARIRIDLKLRRVQVEPLRSTPAGIEAAIRAAGYSPIVR